MGREYIARHFWIQEPGRGEIRSGPLDPPGPGDVRVRALYSGVSRGTESLVFRGRVPESVGDAMRAPFQEGDFPGPVKYGYMSVGVVEEDPGPVDGAAARDLAGRTVFCLHPHQDLYVVPRTAVHAVPEGVPAGRAVLTANLETAWTALRDAESAAGPELEGVAPSEGPDRGVPVVVIGAGVVGLLVGWLCRVQWGAEVLVVEVNPAREEEARALGLEFETEAPWRARSAVVFHASGTEAGLRSALRSAADDGLIVELSWYGTEEVALPLGEDFHARRLTLKSSQVGAIPPHLRGEWTPRRRMGCVLELLRDDDLDVLISGESDFEELPRVMETLSADPSEALCHRIRYPAAGERRDRTTGRDRTDGRG